MAIQHPGSLFNDLLAKYQVSPYQCARALHIPHRHVYALRDSKRGITPLLALKLARYFPGTSAAEWLALQAAYDLEQTRRDHEAALNDVQPLAILAPTH